MPTTNTADRTAQQAPANRATLDHFMRCAWVNARVGLTYREFLRRYEQALSCVYHGQPLPGQGLTAEDRALIEGRRDGVKRGMVKP